jgi:glycosyltransferase involved in cell wall biosynthesis
MKYIFVLNSGYPTQKAYGITTKYSIRALAKLGFDVELWAPKSDFPISDSFVFVDTSKFELKLLAIVPAKNSHLLATVKFKIREIIFPLRVLISQKFELIGNVLWVRDVPIAFWAVVLRTQSKVVLEIHHLPKGIQYAMLKIVAKGRLVQLTGITSQHVRNLEEIFNPRNQVLLTPMAAPDEFFQENRQRRHFNFNVGYVGKLLSSGNSNGILEMLDEFAQLLQSKPALRLTLIGIEDESIATLQEYSKSINLQNQIEIVGHLSANELISAMSNLDVGIIPYPNSSYNNSRFPIKILEYASLGVTLLASDTPAHRRILFEDIAYFYIPGKVDSMAKSLETIIAEFEKSNARRIAARYWAESFTYEARVLPAVTALNDF